MTPGENDKILHYELKKCTENIVDMEYILDRLEKEFKDSLAAAIKIKSQASPSPEKRRSDEERK